MLGADPGAIPGGGPESIQAPRRDLDLRVTRAVLSSCLGRFHEVLDRGRSFVEGISLNAIKKRGVLQIRDMVAASSCTTGWTRGKLCRAMRRHGIPAGYGKP